MYALARKFVPFSLKTSRHGSNCLNEKKKGDREEENKVEGERKRELKGEKTKQTTTKKKKQK